MKRLPLHPDGPPLLLVEREVPEPPNPSCKKCARNRGGADVVHPCIEPSTNSATLALHPQDAGTHGTLLVVVEAPTQGDDGAGEVFTQGKLTLAVRTIIETVWPGRVVYTAALRCASNAKLHPAHLAACRPYLAHDLLTQAPDRVLCLGSQAFSAVTGRGMPPLDARGAHVFLEDGTPVYLMIHPGMTTRNRFIRGWYGHDLQDALLGPIPTPPDYTGTALVLESDEDAEQACADLEGSLDRVDVDTETYGCFGDTDFRVLTIAAATDEHAYVWDEAELGPLATAPSVRRLMRILEDPQHTIGAQNAVYDWNAVHFGLQSDFTGPVECSRQLRKLALPGSPGDLELLQFLVGRGGWKAEGSAAGKQAEAGLQLLAAADPAGHVQQSLLPPTGPERWLDQPDLPNALDRIRAGRPAAAYRFAYIDPEVRQRYCAQDTTSAGACIDAFEKTVRAEPGLKLVHDEVVSKLHRAVAMMVRNGVLMDRAAVARAQLHMSDIVTDMEDEMQVWGEFSPASTADVARVLFTELGLPCRRRTATGLPGTSAEVLDECLVTNTMAAADPRLTPGVPHPCASAIKAWRTASSWKTRYADSMSKFIRDDGRLHPTIMMDGTETGRPSCSDPNMFNLPGAKSFEGRLVRDMVVAPPGWVLLEVDQSQVELRKAAELSGDPLMTELFRSGQDFHLATAKLIAPYLGYSAQQVEALTKDDVLRDQAKTVNFAVLYGTSLAGLAYGLNISKSDAGKIVNAILGQFRKLKLWIDGQLRDARASGWARTYWRGQPGRVRRLELLAEPHAKGHDTHQRASWNTPVQGSAADITNAALGDIQAWLDAEDPTQAYARLVLTVYDSVVLEVRADALDRVTQHVIDICESQPSGDVPLVADAKYGRSWGSMKDWKHGTAI